MMIAHLHQARETTMDYLEDHRIDAQDIRGGWIVVLLASLGLVALAL